MRFNTTRTLIHPLHGKAGSSFRRLPENAADPRVRSEQRAT